jgi:hypothetical protein
MSDSEDTKMDSDSESEGGLQLSDLDEDDDNEDKEYLARLTRGKSPDRDDDTDSEGEELREKWKSGNPIGEATGESPGNDTSRLMHAISILSQHSGCLNGVSMEHVCTVASLAVRLGHNAMSFHGMFAAFLFQIKEDVLPEAVIAKEFSPEVAHYVHQMRNVYDTAGVTGTWFIDQYQMSSLTVRTLVAAEILHGMRKVITDISQGKIFYSAKALQALFKEHYKDIKAIEESTRGVYKMSKLLRHMRDVFEMTVVIGGKEVPVLASV